jgi:hypothetical protein
MFVRFRETSRSLQCSLIETRRVAGKVRHEHIASLGALPVPPSIADRVAFWAELHPRLFKLSNRIEAETRGKVIGQIHARIPMPTADEQRQLQKENAEADERFWSSLQHMNAAMAEDHKGLLVKTQNTIAKSEDAAKDAFRKACPHDVAGRRSIGPRNRYGALPCRTENTGGRPGDLSSAGMVSKHTGEAYSLNRECVNGGRGTTTLRRAFLKFGDRPNALDRAVKKESQS